MSNKSGDAVQNVEPVSSSSGAGFGVVTDFKELDAKLNTLHLYWQSKRRDEYLPRRKDIDPIEIPRLMSSIAIVDILRDPFDFRYRLVGTLLVDRMGGERTGKRMREIFTPEAIDATARLIEMMTAKKVAVACRGSMPWLNKDYRLFQAIILPLVNEADTVDMALMGLHFER